MRIRSCRGDQKVQRLHAGIAGALGHNIKELPVGLGVQLIEDDAMNIEAVLGIGLRRQHLIKAVRRRIDDPLLGGQNLHPLGKRRTHPHHIRCHIKNDGGLLAVSSAAIDLGPLLSVPAAKQKSDCRSKLALSIFLWYFHIGCVKLSVAVGLQDTEQVPDDLLLPVQQFKTLPGPGALRVTQVFDEANSPVCFFLVIMRSGKHESRGLIVRQLRIGKFEARPPLVFHKEVKGRLDLPQQMVDELNCCVQHFHIRMQPVVCIALLQRHVGDMEDHIGRFQLLSHRKVCLELFQQIFRFSAPIDPLDHLPGTKFAKQLFFVVMPEIYPIGIKHHMIPRCEISRKGRLQIVRIDDGLDPVETKRVYLSPQILPASVRRNAVA